MCTSSVATTRLPNWCSTEPAGTCPCAAWTGPCANVASATGSVFISGDVASSMWAGTEGSAWIVVEGERFTASSGCRDFEGDVEVGEDTLGFGDVVQTDPMCAEEYREVDEAMQAIFGGEVEHAIEAGRLTFTQTGGEVGLGLHEDE